MYKVEQLTSGGAWIFVASFEDIEAACSFECRLNAVTRVWNVAKGREVIAY